MDSPTSINAASPAPSLAHSWPSGCRPASTLIDDTAFPLETDQYPEEVPPSEPNIGEFYLACLQGGDILQACLASSDVDLNSPLPDESGYNTFHRILLIPANQFKDGKGEVIKLLLQHGADPLASNGLGDNVLHILAGSAEQENHDILCYLLDGDISDLPEVRTACIENIDRQNNFGDTPLIAAVLHNQLLSVQLLLRSGADMEVCGEFDMTAMEIATSRGYHDIINMLKQYS